MEAEGGGSAAAAALEREGQEPEGLALLRAVRAAVRAEAGDQGGAADEEAERTLCLAAELFLGELAARAHAARTNAASANLHYKDVANAVAAAPNLDFLQDVVPRKVKATVLLERAAAAAAQRTLMAARDAAAG